MGATPVEAVVVMLTFNTYTYFTIYSQEHRISFKNFTFFPGIRIVIPILLTIAGIAIQPFMGITFFVAIFLLEIFAMIYKQMEPKIRPSIRELLIMCGIASILVVIGLTLVQFIPKEWYFAFDGIVIIGVAYFMWAVGDRNAMKGVIVPADMEENAVKELFDTPLETQLVQQVTTRTIRHQGSGRFHEK